MRKHLLENNEAEEDMIHFLSKILFHITILEIDSYRSLKAENNAIVNKSIELLQNMDIPIK